MSNRGYSPGPDLSCRPPRHLNMVGLLKKKVYKGLGGGWRGGGTGTTGLPA